MFTSNDLATLYVDLARTMEPSEDLYAVSANTAVDLIMEDGWTLQESRDIFTYALFHGCTVLQAALVTKVI